MMKSCLSTPAAFPFRPSPPAPLAAPTAETGVPVAQPARPDEAAPDVEALGNRIADLAARIQAATYQLLVLIRQFDERDGWEGFASCADWLSWRIGLAPGAAREKVRVAHALAKLPRLSEALRRGVVSYSKVRAVTRVATPATEQALLDVALAGTAAHVEQVVRTWRRVDRAAEQAEDRRRYESRALHTWVDDDGMIVVRGRLTPEVGAVLRRALEDHAAAARPGNFGVLDGAAVDRAAASRPGESPAVDGATAGHGPETPAPYVPAGTYPRRAGAVSPAAGEACPALPDGPSRPGPDVDGPARRGRTACPGPGQATAPAAASRPSTRRAASTSPRRRPGGWPATPPP